MPISTYTIPTEKIVHNTSVDFSSRFSIINPIHIVQYDNSLPIISVELKNDNKTYILPSNIEVWIRWKKQDNTFVRKQALGCNSERNTVYFEITQQMVMQYGSFKPVVELIIPSDSSDPSVASSGYFSVLVDRNPIQNGDIESMTEYEDPYKTVCYTKTEIDSKLSGKANKATTLADYGITDGENVSNKVSAVDFQNLSAKDYPSINALYNYHINYVEPYYDEIDNLKNSKADKSTVDTALSGKLDNTAGAVTSDKIANGAITPLKLANGAVSGSNIAQNQINTNHLQSGAVTADKLAETVKNDIRSKASLIALVETGYLQLKDINNNVLSSVKLPTSASADIRAELNNLVAEGAISGIATGVYNVVDFGAVGDGVTDDTAAFVACINNANGHPVIIPPGTYVVNYANCGDGKAIYLLGIGNPTIIRSIAPDNNDKAPLFKFNNVPSAYISGIKFNPQRDNFLITATTTKAIDNSVIDETEYQEWIDTACLYFFRGGKNIVIENCTFTNCSREGIYCGKGEFADIIVRNNNFKETSACLWLRDGTYKNVIFEDNYCDGCRTMPVEFDNTDYNYVASVIKNAVVRNNKFYNACKCAVQFRAIDGLTVENNEYTNRGQLYEHGRKSSDDLKKSFIWGLGNESEENTLFAQNINIKNNKGVTGTVLQLQPNSKCNGSVAQFKNVKVSENDFTVDGSYVVARCTENLSIVRNEMQGGEKSNLLRATAVRNVTIDKNNITSGARIYYEETIKTEIEEEKIIDGETVIEKVTYTMVGDGENIKMLNNSANLIAAPFILTNYGSGEVFAKVALDLENNKLNTWNLIDVNQYYKSCFYSKSRNNVDTSGITSAALGSPTNNKYGFNANSVVDLHSLDTTEATAIDGYVVLRSAVTFAFPGRKIQVIITGQAVKTDTSGTSANKILNEITVPAGGILTLTYTGSGWYAS